MHTLFLTFWLTIQAFTTQYSGNPDACDLKETGFLFASSDQGNTWKDIGKGLPESLNPISFWAEGGTYYLGANSGLYVGSAMVPVTKWEKSLLQQKDIRGVYPGQHGPYAVCQWHGFYEFQKGSGLWRSMTTSLEDQAVNTLVESKNGILYAGSESGLFTSADHGKSWTAILQKGPVNELLVTDHVLIACTNTNAWKSTDNGKNWSRVSTGTQSPFKVVALQSGLAALCLGPDLGGMRAPNTVYLSKDNGATWNPMPHDLPSGMSDIYELLQSGNDLFASGREGIYRSSDDGQSWTRVKEKKNEKGGFFKLTLSEGELFILYMEGC